MTRYLDKMRIYDVSDHTASHLKVAKTVYDRYYNAIIYYNSDEYTFEYIITTYKVKIDEIREFMRMSVSELKDMFCPRAYKWIGKRNICDMPAERYDFSHFENGEKLKYCFTKGKPGFNDAVAMAIKRIEENEIAKINNKISMEQAALAEAERAALIEAEFEKREKWLAGWLFPEHASFPQSR